MSRLVWDELDNRIFETGLRQGVLYPIGADGTYAGGVAWNGLTGVTESPSGAEPTPIYANDTKYLTMLSSEDFAFTLEAFTYPDEFAACDGSLDILLGSKIGQQKRKSFGLCYRTILGNFTEGIDFGYKLHLVYGAMASPSEKGCSTINNDPEAISFSWESNTTPIKVEGLGSFSHVVVDSTKIIPAKLAALETILYGDLLTDARLPLPGELMRIVTDEILDSNYDAIKDSTGGVLLDGRGASGI